MKNGTDGLDGRKQGQNCRVFLLGNVQNLQSFSLREMVLLDQIGDASGPTPAGCNLVAGPLFEDAFSAAFALAAFKASLEFGPIDFFLIVQLQHDLLHFV